MISKILLGFMQAGIMINGQISVLVLKISQLSASVSSVANSSAAILKCLLLHVIRRSNTRHVLPKLMTC